MEQIIQEILKRLLEGRGAEVVFQSNTQKAYRIVIVPAPLYSTDKAAEVMIVCEGKGAHFWDGQTPLNQFKLISSGFPWFVAGEVAKLIDALMKQGRKTYETKTAVLQGGANPMALPRA